MTAESKPERPDIALSDEAIDWLVKLYSGRATDEDRAAFIAWRLQSHDHELAAREAEAIWQGIGIVGDKIRDEERNEARAKLTRRSILGVGGLALIGAGATRSGLVGPYLFADYTTGVGEQRTITLPDGSSVFLNANSALSTDFTDDMRSLTLHEGQATFTVAHDVERPFVVEARRGRTQALGTMFDVDIRPEEVVVTVIEGTVAVTTDAAPSDSVTATVDERVRYALGAPSAAEPVDASIETAWRRGKLIFNRRPLGDVVAEIERYRSGQIIIASDRLRKLEVTGVFDLSDVEAILNTVEETLPVRVTRLPLVTIIR
ncbi:FecR family protein [Pseudochelatococcus sp. B33]